MAGLASSTLQKASKHLRQLQANSDEISEALCHTDNEDEVAEFTRDSKASTGQSASGSPSFAGVGASRAVARYSTSAVRSVKTLCLFSCFFGLGISVAILGPTLMELKCQTGAQLEQMSFAFTSRSIGYLLGSITGGWLFDRYNGHVILSVSCLWATLMMLVLPYVRSISGLIIVVGLLGIGLGSLDTGGNVLLLNIWKRKSRPYMQALHFVFAFGALVAPLLAQPFLQDSGQSLNNNNFTNSSALNATPITRDICKTLNPTSHKTMPVTWAYWIGSVPLAITFVGFLIFVFSKACSLQESEIQEEDPSKAKQGSLIYRMVILSLFSLFLLLYVGFEVAYGGYIFTFGRTARPTLDEDTAAFLTSAFWGSFAFGRLASVPVARFLKPTHMLGIDMVGFLVASMVLLSQIKDGDCKASDSTKLWLGTVLLGLSMASVFPTSISWAEYFMNVSGRTASVLVVASSCGEMLIPLAVGNTIGDTVGPCALMACAFAVSVLVVIIFLMILCAGRYFKRHSAFAGMLYQRTQKQEEGRRQQKPADEVLELLQQKKEVFNNGNEEFAM